MGMPTCRSTNALLVASRLGERLTEGDADVLDRVVRVDVQIALGVDIEVDEAVARDLVEHVFQKWNPGLEAGHAGAVQIHADRDLGFFGISRDAGAACHGFIR